MSADKLDKATDAIKAQAEEAHLHDRSATLTALADCERALKRITKRASVAKEMERVELVQTRGPTVEFSGRQLAQTQFNDSRTSDRVGFEIWETAGGALVAVIWSESSKGSDHDTCRVTVAPPTTDAQEQRLAVMEAFAWDLRARSMVKKLGWSLKIEVE